MTKRANVLAKEFARTFTKFVPVRAYLYCRDPVFMLRGFAFDMPPGICYVWKYYFPLFGDAGFLNLSLGYRIHSGHIRTAGKTLKEVYNQVSEVLVKEDNFSDIENIEEMLNFAEDHRLPVGARLKLLRDMRCFETLPIEAIIAKSSRNLKQIMTQLRFE